MRCRASTTGVTLFEQLEQRVLDLPRRDRVEDDLLKELHLQLLLGRAQALVEAEVEHHLIRVVLRSKELQ